MLHRDDVSNCVRLLMPRVSDLMCLHWQACACKNITKSTPYVTYIRKTYIDGMPKPQVGSNWLKKPPPPLPFGEILGSYCVT